MKLISGFVIEPTVIVRMLLAQILVVSWCKDPKKVETALHVYLDATTQNY